MTRTTARETTGTRKTMTRTTVNFWLDLFLLLLFLTLIAVSVIVRFVFPPGPSAAGWTLWGWGYAEWAAAQFALVAAMALSVLLHVMLHWTWVCGVVAGFVAHRRGGPRPRLDEGSRTLYGVGLLIVILNVVGAAIAAAWLMVEPPPGW